MSVTTSNLVLGPGSIYYAPVGTAEPTSATEEPGAEWINVGGTTDGVTLTVSQEYTELEVDQIVDIPESRLTKREFTVETNLAELTLDNLKLALNGGTIDTASGTSTYTPASGNSAVSPNYSALMIEGISPGGLKRRIVVRKALSNDDVEFAYAKEDQSVYSVTFSAHYVNATSAPFVVVDEVPVETP